MTEPGLERSGVENAIFAVVVLVLVFTCWRAPAVALVLAGGGLLLSILGSFVLDGGRVPVIAYASAGAFGVALMAAGGVVNLVLGKVRKPKAAEREPFADAAQTSYPRSEKRSEATGGGSDPFSRPRV